MICNGCDLKQTRDLPPEPISFPLVFLEVRGLSEGQAQRVAVARALISGSPILLLDEATSALDEATEARMLKNLSGQLGKTCLIVTYRPAALSICDYEFKIVGNGLHKIVET